MFAIVLLGLVALGSLLGRDERLGRDVPVVPTPPGTQGHEATTEVEDPFAWADDRKADFERRAAAGNANVLYRFSPGGAAATARRTAHWRSAVEAAARAGDVDPDLVEALVFLESGGREDALTGAGVEGAAGLGQIVAGTARELLGMHVDGARSRHLTRRIERERRRGHAGKVRALEADRRRADERFDPAKALAATGRYLAIAQRRFGRDDLALESYHMGIGNLEGVLRAFSGERSAAIAEVVRDEELSWAEVYFDSTARRHVAAHRRLRAFSDDSSNYYWKLLAARDVMALWREDARRLDRLARAHTRKNSAEEVLHPPGE